MSEEKENLPTKLKIKDIVKLLKSLTNEDLKKLKEEWGIIVPMYLIYPPKEPRRWGYVCTNCGKQAMEFIGIQFQYQNPDTGEWEVSDSPPLGIPLEEIPWVQDHKRAKYKYRSSINLRCQFCNQLVALNHDRSLIGKRIRPIVYFEKIHKYEEYMEKLVIERRKRHEYK